MTRILTIVAVITVLVATSNAQGPDERYISKGDRVASFPIHFKNGFLFVSAPMIDTLADGTPDTLTRSFLIDPRASNDGSYLPADSSETRLGTRTFLVPASPQRTLVWKLAPSLAKGNFKKADPAFGGVIGYGILRQYVSVINFAAGTLSLYTLDPAPKFSKRLDTGAVHVPYFDDVILNYCHCNFPTIWLEPDADPLNKGRWHLSIADRQSVIYQEALPAKLKKKINEALRQDSIRGKIDPYAGIELSEFKLGGKDIAKLEPHRPIDVVPGIFKDLSVTVMGTVAIDVLRHFHAVIIDPSQSKLMLCNY